MEEIAVIYEDNHIIVVIKPYGVLSQPDETGDESLIDQIKEYIKVKENKAGNVYVGGVHRLDRVTGGVMIFGKTSKATARLAEQITDGRFKKKYFAVVVGEPKPREATLVDSLLKDEKTNTVSVVGAAVRGAKRAELTYKTVSSKDGVTLTEISLETGRSHQIRVQMAHNGTPIFGDARYGGDKLGKGWNLALWATELVFKHPTTDDTLKFIVNPPEITPWTKFDFNRKDHKTRGVSE